MARPIKPVDWDRVEWLLKCGCSGVEIAAEFDVHPETLYRKVEDVFNVGFTEFSAIKKAKGDVLLREAQLSKALEKDNTMMIWLGKQRLGQKENHDAVAPSNDKMLGDILTEIKGIKDTKIEQPVAPIPETDPIDTAGDAQV